MKQKEREEKKQRDARKTLQVADADGTTRYRVQLTYAFAEIFTVKAVNEQAAIKAIEDGFGRSAGRKLPEVVDIAVVDMSAATVKGQSGEDESGKGLIEVVAG